MDNQDTQTGRAATDSGVPFHVDMIPWDQLTLGQVYDILNAAEGTAQKMEQT